ncbi:hypothetical protein JW998_00235 [candidate division KSB1 bacterium]|nr:hypothetical protein [candidate division KSB1 bacterium]
MKTYAFNAILVVAVTFAALNVTAMAQTPATQADSTSSVLQVDQNNVKLFIDKIQVEGRLERPQAVFILPGQTPDIDDIQIERSFMKEIFRPVEKRFTVETKFKPDYTKKRKDVIEW